MLYIASIYEIGILFQTIQSELMRTNSALKVQFIIIIYTSYILVYACCMHTIHYYITKHFRKIEINNKKNIYITSSLLRGL